MLNPSSTWPLLPSLNVAQTLVQRLSDPALGLPTVNTLLASGMGAFDHLAWTEDGASPQKKSAAKTTLWKACLDTTDRPTPAMERLADDLDRRFAQAGEQGLCVALGHWINDDWAIQTLIEHEKPRALVVWVLQRAMSSLRHAPGPWPHEQMLARFPTTLTSHPQASHLPESWLRPLERSMVQGLMLWSTRLLNSTLACELIETSVDAGVPLRAWDARWQYVNPENPRLGVSCDNALYLHHLGRVDRWTMAVWWVAHLPGAWRTDTVVVPEGHFDNTACVVQESLVHRAWTQSLNNDEALNVYNDTEVNESRLFIVQSSLEAARQGDPHARVLWDEGLLNTVRQHLRQGRPVCWSDEQHAALYALCVAYEQQRLRPLLGVSAPQSLSRPRL